VSPYPLRVSAKASEGAERADSFVLAGENATVAWAEHTAAEPAARYRTPPFVANPQASRNGAPDDPKNTQFAQFSWLQTTFTAPTAPNLCTELER
jgi:hypothetical protein